MKKILIAAAVAFSTGVFAGEAHAPKVYREIATAPTNQREAEIASLFDRWNAALATGDASSVAKLYAPDAVLEPTVSNEVRTTPPASRTISLNF